MQPPSPPSEEYRKELVTYRSWLNQVDFETSNEQDKLLTTLSAGALSVSVGFFRDAPNLSRVLQCTLLCSWMFFALTLVAALFAFRPTRDMLRAEITRTDALLAGETQPTNERVAHAQRRARWRNTLALWLFVAGMVLQVAFLTMRFR
jgi:hypothetical protein